MMVDFVNGVCVMFDLLMFVDGVENQEEIIVVGDIVWFDVLIFEGVLVFSFCIGFCNLKWVECEVIEVDLIVFDVGSYYGLIFYQYQKFIVVVCGEIEVEVSVSDGLMVVVIGIVVEISV